MDYIETLQRMPSYVSCRRPERYRDPLADENSIQALLSKNLRESSLTVTKNPKNGQVKKTNNRLVPCDKVLPSVEDYLKRFDSKITQVPFIGLGGI